MLRASLLAVLELFLSASHLSRDTQNCHPYSPGLWSSSRVSDLYGSSPEGLAGS